MDKEIPSSQLKTSFTQRRWVINTAVFSSLLMMWFVIALAFYSYVAPMLKLFAKQPQTPTLVPILESVILFSIFILLYILTKRKRLAAVLVTVFYLAFLCASIIKIKLLNVPIFANDLILLGDLVRTWQDFKLFLPFILLFLMVMVGIIWFEYKRTKPDNFSATKSLMLFAIAVLMVYAMNSQIRLFLKEQNIFIKVNSNLAKRAFKNGMLLGFVQSMFFTGRPDAPEGYSKEYIRHLFEKYDLDQPTSSSNEPPINVIVLMIESLTNPTDFHWSLNEAVLPHFNAIIDSHPNGHVMSPVFGGKSINSEFELMTGLSNLFNPPESTPYHEFVSSHLPTVPRAFHTNGYDTSIIHAVSLSGFGFTNTYQFFGIKNKISLTVEDDHVIPDPTSNSVSSETLTKEIFALLDDQKKSFVFVFPNSSHSPYSMDDYPENTLSILNANTPPTQSDTLLAYFNALNHVDQLMGAIIDRYEGSAEKTLMVVVGDHQPRMYYYSKYLKDHSKKDEILNKYSVPYAVWANYPLDNHHKTVTSMNLIPSLIFHYAGIPVRGFMKFNVILDQQFELISHLYRNYDSSDYKMIREELTDELLADYKSFQYDLLFGSNHLFDIENETD